MFPSTNTLQASVRIIYNFTIRVRMEERSSTFIKITVHNSSLCNAAYGT